MVAVALVRRVGAGLGAAALALVAACSGTQPTSSTTKTITVYTCVSDTTIQPVIATFEKLHPGSQVRLYRAPTGDMNARVAGDVRSGGLKADVLWACDPLTMHDYAQQGLLASWQPRTQIPARYRTDAYVGVAVLYLVAVTQKQIPPPHSWQDLTRPVYSGSVVVPDPSFAASALGALGYFGTGFYARLRRNGAVQVSSPDDVTTGVAQGTYKTGITIANSAYAAKQDGSPIQVTWPRPGAVAVYGPVAVTRHGARSATAKAFVSYVTSRAGQRVIGASGSYPTLPGGPTPTIPAGAPVIQPDWATIAARRDSLLAAYQKIFGG